LAFTDIYACQNLLSATQVGRVTGGPYRKRTVGHEYNVTFFGGRQSYVGECLSYSSRNAVSLVLSTSNS